MEIKINPQTINLSPQAEKGNTLEETIELIEQLEKQFLYGDNACFLVSGYRGTGKTTLIHKLENHIKDSNIIFVHLNISKYEKYSLILRRLIREIYLSFSATDKYKEVKKRNKKITDKLELLYEHTFYEINHGLNSKKVSGINSDVTGIFSLKEIITHSIPIIALIVAKFSDTFNIVGEVIKNLEDIALIGSLISIIVASVKIKSKFYSEASSTEEMVRKSLYDDEIAEYHLKNILRQLKCEGIKMVVVFDEVDKIEEESEVKKIISEMKPLLLSGLASFILISGQKLYYNYIDANIIDDSIMSSIFTKNIHVPLATNTTLLNLFKKYTDDKIDVKNNVVRVYIDSLILNSNRIVRKFVSLILQDIYWVDKECYLKIEEADLEQFNSDSELLSIIDSITLNYVDDSEYEDGIKDFFTYQLFIWLKKMKRKGKLEFHRYDVFKLEENHTDMYPRWCEIKLNDLCSTLLETLANRGLLEKKISDENEVCYKWGNKVKIKSEEIEDEITSIKMSLLQNIIDLETWARYALLMVNPKESNKVALSMLIKRLINKGVINNTWMDEEKRALYDLANKIRHGEKIDSSQIYSLENNNNNLKRMVIKFIEEYCQYTVKNCFKKYKDFYDVQFDVRDISLGYEFDIVALSNMEKLGDIIFEIKYYNHYSGKRVLYDLIDRIKRKDYHNGKNNKLVVLWFSKEDERKLRKIENDFHKLAEVEIDRYREDIFFICIHQHANSSEENPIEVLLYKIIEAELGDIEENGIA